MSSAIDTDYVVIGAGAAGLAFADTLLTESPCSVTIIDEREGPGGHWRVIVMTSCGCTKRPPCSRRELHPI